MDDRDGAREASRLEELLSCEAELAELLASTQQEARRRVEEARARASRAEADVQAQLAAEADRVRSRIRGAAELRVRRIQDEARERASRFDSVPVDRIEDCAESLYRLLVASGGEP